MKQQTAVEWLVEQIWPFGKPTLSQKVLIEQARQMEKNQKKECWESAHQAGRFEGKGIAEENWQTFEQYYSETYETPIQ